MKFEIRQTPLEKIKPFEKNPKIHSDEQIKKISESINKFGFINPVVIDKDYTIIAGHGRYLASIKLGLTEVPTIEVNHLSQKEIDAFRIFDNKSNELSSWDERILAQTLTELDSDLTKLTGFTDSEVFSYKNPYNFDDITKQMDRLETEKKEEVEWKAKIEKKDFDELKKKIHEKKVQFDLGSYYSDYANGKFLLQLMQEILDGFKLHTEASDYLESYDSNKMKKNGENLSELMENVK